MNKKMIIIGIELLVVIGAILGYTMYVENNKISFAQCIFDSGTTMYGTESCTFCNAQKAEFGKGKNYIDYVDCNKNSKLCQDEGVESFPTWKNSDGITLVGKQSFDELSRISGCDY